MIPAFNKLGYLPPGRPYQATWQEFTARFGTTGKRKVLMGGLRTALLALKAAGCRIVYVDGSFVTSKPEPCDWDACWEMDGVNFNLLDDLIVDEEFTLVERKRRYLGDLFLQAPRLPGRNFVSFFQKDRDGTRKGIVKINLDTVQ
jgi:hypothetical protein